MSTPTHTPVGTKYFRTFRPQNSGRPRLVSKGTRDPRSHTHSEREGVTGGGYLQRPGETGSPLGSPGPRRQTRRRCDMSPVGTSGPGPAGRVGVRRG